MIVRVQLFALARDLAGCELAEVELAEPATVGDLRRALAAQHPALATLLARSLLAVNERYAGEDCPLSPQADVACIPPVSGG